MFFLVQPSMNFLLVVILVWHYIPKNWARGNFFHKFHCIVIRNSFIASQFHTRYSVQQVNKRLHVVTVFTKNCYNWYWSTLCMLTNHRLMRSIVFSIWMGKKIQICLQNYQFSNQNCLQSGCRLLKFCLRATKRWSGSVKVFRRFVLDFGGNS